MNNHQQTNIQPISFRDSILLAGILAKIYAESDYNSPIHNWAWAVPNRELPVGDVLYRVGPARCMVDGQEVNCVQLTVIRPQETVHYQFPITELRSVDIQLRGFQI